jgi:hypothetical protein
MSKARTEEERRWDATLAGAALARRQVGDRATALLVGGRWLDGYWYLVDAEGQPEYPMPTHWVNEAGEVVDRADVQGIRVLDPVAVRRFTDELGDVEGRKQCGGSFEPVDRTGGIDEGVTDEQVWCPECECTVPIVSGDDGKWIIAEHDRLGREYLGAV